MNENDLRVKRTRRLLQEAFLVLANEQDFANITIRDVTRKAQVGYKTFFRHYDSIETLLQTIIDNFLEAFREVALPSTQHNAVVENTRYVFRVAMENRRLFLAIFNSPKSMTLLKPLMEHAYQDSKQLFMAADVPNELVGYHFATSMLNLTKWWLENQEACSLEEMVEYALDLVIRPMEQL